MEQEKEMQQRTSFFNGQFDNAEKYINDLCVYFFLSFIVMTL